MAGRREEDARERKEKRCWVRLRGEVRKDGFAVAVAVGPWVACETRRDGGGRKKKKKDGWGREARG